MVPQGTLACRGCFIGSGSHTARVRAPRGRNQASDQQRTQVARCQLHARRRCLLRQQRWPARPARRQWLRRDHGAEHHRRRPELTCEASGSILIPECVHRIRPSDPSPSVRRDRRVSHAERCCATLHHAVRQPERSGDGPRSLKTGRTRGLDRPIPLIPGQLSCKARGRQQALSHPSA